MKLLFDEYAGAIYEAFISAFIYVFVVYVFLNSVLNINVEYIKGVTKPIDIYVDNTPVEIAKFSAKDILIYINDNFNYLEYVEAFNTNGEDIKTYVTIIDLPDLKKEGEYEVTYSLRYNGYTKAIKAKLIIVDKQKEMKTNEEYV